MPEKRIYDLQELAIRVAEEKKKGKKIVHCHGCFDLLHIGHIRYFEQAKAMGDLLVVTVTPDRFVDKGPHRPAFNELLRAEAIASLWCVDFVAINQWPTAEETLRLLRPDFYVKGSEYRPKGADMTGKIEQEEAVVAEIGARLAFTDDIVFSSSRLINERMSIYPKEMQEYVEFFRMRHNLAEVLSVIDQMETLKVLVIGDVIIDEYVYGEAIGKSSKDPVLALRYQSEDRFAGGVLAVANHVANFAGHVELLAVLGARKSYEDFIRSKLSSRIHPQFIMEPDIPTISKRRIIEGYSLNKLLELYEMNDGEIGEPTEAALCAAIREKASEVDLVLVSDFGHGTITRRVIETVCDCAPFLAVNTQANAGNRGFNTITKYPRADYACIAEHEMRLEARDARGQLRPILERLRQQLKASYMVVTCGKKGCQVSHDGDEFVSVPAFARKVVDRVGAGDAFLSVTSMAAALKAPFEILGLIGNVVGAEAVEIVGNDKAIDKLNVKKSITALLK